MNNTVVGWDFGIQVSDFASPTLLNNIITNTGTGIDVDNSSTSTVIGGSLYKDNGVNVVIAGASDFTNPALRGDFSVWLQDPADPLFVNLTKQNCVPGERFSGD